MIGSHRDPDPDRSTGHLPREASGGRVRVAVQAADPVTRAGATHLLATVPDIEVVAPDASSTPVADVAVTVLLCTRLDDATTVELRRLGRHPDRSVVLVAEALREPELMIVLECGVRNIVRRDEVNHDELVAAVRSAARRETRLPSDVVGQLMAHVGRAHRASAHSYAPGEPSVGLLPREVDVLRLLAEGLETRDVAEKLAYSERTIKNVIYGLTGRLQLRNRTHAVAYAFREGYL